MKSEFATYREGRIVLDSPVDWPEGMRIEVRPIGVGPTQAAEPQHGSTPKVRQEFLDALNDPECGMDESLWPLSSEETQLLLEHMDAAEPLDLTPEEQRKMEAGREAWKELQKQLTRKSWEELDTMFE